MNEYCAHITGSFYEIRSSYNIQFYINYWSSPLLVVSVSRLYDVYDDNNVQ